MLRCWDGKRREKASWTSGHTAPLNPPTLRLHTAPTPRSIKEPFSTLCSLRHPSLRPAALPSSVKWSYWTYERPTGGGGGGGGGSRAVNVCTFMYMCRKCVTGMNVYISVSSAQLTAQCYQHVPALSSRQRKGREGKPLWA